MTKVGLSLDFQLVEVSRCCLLMDPPVRVSMKLCNSTLLLVTESDLHIGDSKHFVREDHRSFFDHETVQSVRFAEALAKRGLFYCFPLKLKVRNSSFLVLFAQHCFEFDLKSSTFAQLLHSEHSHFKTFKVKGDWVYVLDNLSLHLVHSRSQKRLRVAFPELASVSHFHLSQNGLLIYLFGKRNELFSPKMDFLITRNADLACQQSTNCGLTEFLLFVSKSSRAHLSKGPKSKDKESVEHFLRESLGRFPCLDSVRKDQLRLAYLKFSNYPVLFEREKIAFLIKRNTSSDAGGLLGGLYHQSSTVRCGVVSCSAPIASLSVKYLKVVCAVGHQMFVAGNTDAFFTEMTPRIRVCGKCEVFFDGLKRCLICESSLN